jgi:hypothetical protein
MATTAKLGRNQNAIPLLALALAASGAMAGCGGAVGSGSAGSSGRARPAGQMAVRVVDESGAPIAGAEISGSIEVNPGPTASFCCTPESFGQAVTGADGRGFLPRPPITGRKITVTASRDGWLGQTVPCGNGMLGGTTELTKELRRRPVPAPPAP